ncbi:MAG TPA: TIGR03621 family F420-dependent LLM class oxidoreductase [Candidatus Dormibacteraeota bacterium]
MTRPFRFAVQEHRATTGQEWTDKVRRVESLGYTALYLPDHFSDQLGAFSALAAAAMVTSELRLGHLVLDNDYRHPAVTAKEIASLDVLSGGRADFGLGAGWEKSDYDATGIAYDTPGVRIERMCEGLAICKGLFAPGPFSFEGKHYRVTGLEGQPKPMQRPHPPILLGGGAKRMLSIAAREADIINVNFNLAHGAVSSELVLTGTAEQTDEKMAWIKEAAGDRFRDLELSVLIFVLNVTDDRRTIAEGLAGAIGTTVETVLDIPHFLIGTIDQIAEDLQRRRERYGISYVIVQGEAAESFAPVVGKLAGQ